MYLFLHEQGYNFFTIPQLTYSEIDYLVLAYNAKNDSKVAGNRVEVR